MEYVHTEMKEHPLRNCWMVWIPKLPFIAPYFGTKKECKAARVHAEQKAASYIKNHQSKTESSYDKA